jgi:hypothetical protein
MRTKCCGQHPGRTFISYSRKDGADLAAGLRKTLEKENLSVWQDIVALEGGRDWWSQIEDALKSKALPADRGHRAGRASAAICRGLQDPAL